LESFGEVFSWGILIGVRRRVCGDLGATSGQELEVFGVVADYDLRHVLGDALLVFPCSMLGSTHDIDALALLEGFCLGEALSSLSPEDDVMEGCPLLLFSIGEVGFIDADSERCHSLSGLGVSEFSVGNQIAHKFLSIESCHDSSAFFFLDSPRSGYIL